jgi:hypothetical protein
MREKKREENSAEEKEESKTGKRSENCSSFLAN